MAEKNWITKEGYEAKKARLEYLTTVERQEIIKKIGEAKEQGDLSENAEYEAAREEQGKRLSLRTARLLTKRRAMTRLFSVVLLH